MSNTNLILGIVVAILGMLLYYTEYYDMAGREDRAWTAQRLLSLNPDKITRINFSNVGQAFQELRKFSVVKNQTDGSWDINFPLKDQADKMVIDTIIGHLYNLESARKLMVAQTDSDEYGFNSPRAIIELFETPESKGQKITLGRRSPVELLSYVKLNDRPEVYLVNAGIDEFLTKTCSDVRKRKLFNLKNRSDIASMSIMIDGMNTLVLKQSDNRWSTDTSFPCPIDNPSADSIADAFRSLLVDFFVEENPPEIASYGLDTPTVSVKVKTTNGDELILLIGKAAEGTLEEDPSRELSGWYCKTNLRKTVYVLAEYQRKKLAKTLLDVRDRTVTKNFELDDINEISFVFADKSTSTVVKSDSRWVIDTDDGPSILCDNKYMDHLISGLSGIKAIGIASDYVKELYKVKLDVPDLVLSLHNSLTNEVLSLAIKWDAKGNLYIHNQKGPTSYVVNGELISLFPEKRADLFNRFPLRNVRPEYVKAVSIEAVAMESIVMERKIIPDKDSSWNLISPVKFNLDERQVAQWLVRLRSVPVSSFLQEGKSGLKQYGLSSPLAKADITFQESLEEKSEQISVYVGSETENKLFHYCMISSMNAVFTIRKSIARLFLAPSITYSTNAQNNINPDKNVLANDTADPSLYRPLESEEKTLPRALIQTSLGSISLILFEDEAPNHVANFIHLSENNFYRDTTFHRVENFCIQGGDPNTKDDDKTNDGKGDPGYSINDEINEKRKNRKYYLSMAHKGPNTGGCQFFILKEDAPWLDGIHTVFGAVTDGGDVVDSILPGTIIEDIHILNKRAHDYVPRKNTF